VIKNCCFTHSSNFDRSWQSDKSLIPPLCKILQFLVSPGFSPLSTGAQTQSSTFMDSDVGKDLMMPIHLQWKSEIVIQNAIIWWSPYLRLMNIHRMLWSKTWETSTNYFLNVSTRLPKLQAQRKMSASSLQQVRCWILGTQFNTDDVVNCSSTPLKCGILVLKHFQPFEITTHVSWVLLHLQSFYLVMQMLWF